MKNMKKIFSALSILSFITVAGISTVACNKINTNIKDDENNDNKNISIDKIFIDLEVYDANGNSLVEAKLDIESDSVRWTADKLHNLTAANLLTDEDKAKSKDSFNFLTDVLKLEAEGDGDWFTKTFKKDKAGAISLNIISVNPVLKAIDGDYAISKGTIKVQWKNDKTDFGEYSVDLKINTTKGIIKQYLPSQSELNWKNFNKEKSNLANFKIGQNRETIMFGERNITNSLIVDSGKGKIIDDIAKIIAQKLEVIIIKVNEVDNNEGNRFVKGDSITIKISLGSVQFSNEYTLTLH